MTTLDPGASDVLTHGLTVRPRSTAFLATSAAPTITNGLEVLVHEVMAAMTTAPWSRVTDVPLAKVTAVGWDGRSGDAATTSCSSGWLPPLPNEPTAGGSDAGNDSSTPSSTMLWIEPWAAGSET